jgi:hypothetical protein
MDIIKVVKMCAVNLMNLFKHILMHFRIDKIALLPERFRNPLAQKLSWEDTYQEMAASDENWSAWDAAINDGLGDSEISAKIEKYAGIADEKLSTEQIMNLTRE